MRSGVSKTRKVSQLSSLRKKSKTNRVSYMKSIFIKGETSQKGTQL
jgi:hypothetical protein